MMSSIPYIMSDIQQNCPNSKKRQDATFHQLRDNFPRTCLRLIADFPVNLSALSATSPLIVATITIYGRPCVYMEGHYVLPRFCLTFLRTPSSEVTERNSNQTLPHVFGSDQDLKRTYKMWGYLPKDVGTKNNFQVAL